MEKINDKSTSSCKKTCCAAMHPMPKAILLECGTHPQDAIFEICRGRVKKCQDFVLDKVIVDTSCLFKPQVKIDFSCIIYYDVQTRYRGYGGGKAEVEASTQGCDKEIEVDLEFELIRICRGAKEVVQKWRYIKEYEIECDDNLEITNSDSFSVTCCDCVCPGCCVYKMKVTGKDFKGSFDNLRVTSPNINVLAQGLCAD